MCPAPDCRLGAIRAARRHSARVRRLKVAIPVAALGAVGLVALASTYSPFGSVPGLTLGSLSLSGSKIAMEAPKLTGFRKDNRPYEVTATAAFQDIRKPHVVELKDLKARLALDEGGGAAHLVAAGGIFDTTKEHLELSDNIRIWTDRGDEALLRSASVDMKGGTVVSREPVRIATPALLLEADGMQLSDNGKTMVFEGRVRAEIRPGPAGGPARGGTAQVLQAQAR